MPGLPESRLITGVHEALTTINRLSGNAGVVIGNASATNYVTGIGTAWVTVVSTTIITPSPASELMVWSYVNFNRQTGTVGDTFFAEIQKDSDADNSQLAFPTDASFQSASVPNDTLNRTFTLIGRYSGIQPGQHTFRIKCSATGDTFQAIATIDIISLAIAGR